MWADGKPPSHVANLTPAQSFLLGNPDYVSKLRIQERINASDPK